MVPVCINPMYTGVRGGYYFWKWIWLPESSHRPLPGKLGHIIPFLIFGPYVTMFQSEQGLGFYMEGMAKLDHRDQGTESIVQRHPLDLGSRVESSAPPAWIDRRQAGERTLIR